MIRLLSLPVLLVLAAVLRLIWSALIPVDPVSDAAAYETFARNMYLHGVYGFTPEQPGAYWAVGTAAIYVGFYTLFGMGPVAVIAANLLSSLLVVWGLWDLGRRWFGETEGRLAALLFALWPLAIQFVTVMASELHFMALMLLGLMAWERAQKLRSMQFWLFLLLSALAFAGATYVRPIALLIPAALALATLLRAPRRGLLDCLKAGLVIVLIFAAVAPWSARNERLFGEPVFMSTNFWSNFWMGNHPGTNGEYAPLPSGADGLGEIERGKLMKSLALEHLKESPGAFVARTIRKAFRLHQRETIGVSWNERAIRARVGDAGVAGLKLASTGWWYGMLLAALAGVVILARREGWWAALLSAPVWLWLYFTGVHAVIVVGDRYHMPAIPVIALLAAVTFGALISWRQALLQSRSR